MAEPFVKIYKKMLKWEWYDDINTCRLFIHCLLRANWESGSWHGIEYQPGQFITSLQTLANETKLSVKQVRVALDHLKRTNEVADLRQGNYRIITVIKWNEYQCKGKPEGNERANQGQTKGKPVATDKEYKEYKELKEVKNININNIIPPTLEMVREYCQERHNSVDPEAFISFYDSKGWMIGKNKMKDWKAAVRTWERSRKENQKQEPKNTVNKKIHNYQERKYDYDALMKELTE